MNWRNLFTQNNYIYIYNLYSLITVGRTKKKTESARGAVPSANNVKFIMVS